MYHNMYHNLNYVWNCRINNLLYNLIATNVGKCVCDGKTSNCDSSSCINYNHEVECSSLNCDLADRCLNRKLMIMNSDQKVEGPVHVQDEQLRASRTIEKLVQFLTSSVHFTLQISSSRSINIHTAVLVHMEYQIGEN